MKKHKKTISITFIAILTILILTILVPLLRARSYTEKELSNLNPGKDIKVTWKKYNIIQPEFEAVSNTSNKQEKFDIKLNRNNIVYWKINDLSNHNGEINNNPKDNLNVTNTPSPIPTITPTETPSNPSNNDTLQPTEISDEKYKQDYLDKKATEQSRTDFEEFRREGRVVTEFSDSKDLNKVVITAHRHPTQENAMINRISINGEYIEEIENMSSTNFSSDDRYIYFTTYEIAPGDGIYVPHSTSSTGKIFRIDVNTRQVEEIYSFEDKRTITFRASSKYIFYSDYYGNIGVINIETKEDRIAKTVSLFFGEHLHSIVGVNEEYGVVAIEDRSTKEFTLYKIYLTDLGIEEVN